MLINAEVGYFIANGVYASATELAHIAERSRHNVNGFLPVFSLFCVGGEPTAALVEKARDKSSAFRLGIYSLRRAIAHTEQAVFNGFYLYEPTGLFRVKPY